MEIFRFARASQEKANLVHIRVNVQVRFDIQLQCLGRLRFREEFVISSWNDSFCVLRTSYS